MTRLCHRLSAGRTALDKIVLNILDEAISFGRVAREFPTGQAFQRIMKSHSIVLKSLAAMLLVVLTAGCATTNNNPNKESLLMGAGFKIITPSKPEQRALLTSLPPDKVTPIMYHGKKYYVLRDVANNRAYVGGPQEYQAYRASRADQNLSNEDLEAAQWNQMSNMADWSGWTAAGFGE
jgi:hypothetical protein